MEEASQEVPVREVPVREVPGAREAPVQEAPLVRNHERLRHQSQPLHDEHDDELLSSELGIDSFHSGSPSPKRAFDTAPVVRTTRRSIQGDDGSIEVLLPDVLEIGQLLAEEEEVSPLRRSLGGARGSERLETPSPLGSDLLGE